MVGNEIRCAALYRVSTMRQARHDADEETLPMQRNAIRRFVSDHPSWKLVAEYTEEGVSAYKNASADRDVLQDVLRDARSRKFTILLIFKADRLSRQSLEYPVILAKFQEYGIQVYSVADEAGGKELKSDGQFDKLLRFIEGWQAETESYNTSIRVSEKMRQIAEKGRWTGGKAPYGYRFDPQASANAPLSLQEKEAEIVRLMFRRYLDEGVGTPTITRDLNANQIFQRNGKPWADGSVRRTMQNPIVTGRLSYGRTARHGRGKRKSLGTHDLDGVILSPVYPHLVIIDEARWQQAMDRMANYNRLALSPGVIRHSRADSGPLLFTGMARCAHCNGPLVSISVTSKKMTAKGPKIYGHKAYLCTTKAWKSKDLCDGQRTYAMKKVEQALLAAIHRTLSTMDTAAVVRRARELAEQRLWTQNSRQHILDKQIRETAQLREAWLARLDQFLVHPELSLYSEDVLAQKVREANEKYQRLLRERETIMQSATNLSEQRQSLDQFLQVKDQWWQQFLSAERPQQKELLKRIVEMITIGRDGYNIYYRFDLQALTGRDDAHTVEWREAGQWVAQS